MSASQPTLEATPRKGIQQSLRLLAGVTSWQACSNVLTIVLLAGANVLLLFPLRFSSGGMLGLLLLACMVSGVTLHQQRRRLKLLREGLIEQMDAVIKQRVKAEKFYGMATQDALTGLYNRRFGETRLQEELGRAEKSEEPLILIAFDFDRFKQINDQHGHAAGDLALKEFSRRLQRAVRACDVPIRAGGDEFLVIFPECSLEKIPQIMSRMDSIAFTYDGKKIPVSFSFGEAQYQPNDTPETITRRADERLYAKKAERKGGEARPASPSHEANPGAQEEADKPVPSAVRSLIADAGFRRSERVLFEMPVDVYVSRENEEPALEEAKTLSVNAHGALLALITPVGMGQALRLVDPRTKKEMECRVCRLGEHDEAGVSEVAVAFVAVAPTFWDVPSVPADWDPGWVPPAERERPQLSFAENAPSPVALSESAVSHLSDEPETATVDSDHTEWRPFCDPPNKSNRPQGPINIEAATVQLSAEALRVLCGDMESAMDVSRGLALDIALGERK